MPSFRFRLQPLLEQKLQARKAAEELLAARQGELANEKQTLEELQVEEEHVAHSRFEQRRQLLIAAASPGASLQKQSDYLRGLDQDLVAAREAISSQQIIIEAAEKNVSTARDEVTSCTREADILQKYRDKLESKFRRELARQEELESDEIGSMVYLSRSHAR